MRAVNSFALHRPAIPLLGRRLPLWGLLGILGAAILLLWAFSPTTVLEFHLGENGPLLKVMPVTLGQRITYTYVHSIQKRPVDEILEVASIGHLVVRETDYDMLGVGLPSDVLDGDYVFDKENKKFKIINMNRDLPVMRVRVATTISQTMTVGVEKFKLDSLAAPMSLLVVDVASQPRIITLLDQLHV